MGAWNTEIEGNDTFQDIYQEFFDLYNKGQDPIEISQQIRLDSADMFDDYDNKYNCRFALALAQWETKCLSVKLFEEVKDIIETGKDIKLWLNLGADSQTIKNREKELISFLKKISIERKNRKRRNRKNYDFKIIKVFSAVSPDNLKEFYVDETYLNERYSDTSGTLMWKDGGGSVFHFEGESRYVSAEWLDGAVLEITHDKEIVFTQKDEKSYFNGDAIRILYKTL